ncbi:MAG: hypothetical protein UHN88_07705 [Eubacterium sp.]|nr:hypothetical protein [Eubacterium sp.]
MFSPAFDGTVAAILAVLAVVFFMGKGNRVTELFEGSNKTRNKKKRTPEQELKYQRVIALFLIILAVLECIMALQPGRVVAVILMAAAVLDICLFAYLTRKIDGE